jgi:hypothetical protein
MFALPFLFEFCLYHPANNMTHMTNANISGVTSIIASSFINNNTYPIIAKAQHGNVLAALEIAEILLISLARATVRSGRMCSEL